MSENYFYFFFLHEYRVLSSEFNLTNSNNRQRIKQFNYMYVEKIALKKYNNKIKRPRSKCETYTDRIGNCTQWLTFAL